MNLVFSTLKNWEKPLLVGPVEYVHFTSVIEEKNSIFPLQKFLLWLGFYWWPLKGASSIWAQLWFQSFFLFFFFFFQIGFLILGLQLTSLWEVGDTAQ